MGGGLGGYGKGEGQMLGWLCSVEGIRRGWEGVAQLVGYGVGMGALCVFG